MMSDEAEPQLKDGSGALKPLFFKAAAWGCNGDLLNG